MGQVSGPTSFKRQARDDKGKKSSAGTGRGKRWGIAGLSLAILLGTGGAIYAYMQVREDPEVAEVRDKMQELREQAESATGEDRREQWGQMREAMENLNEDQRRELRDGFRQEQQQRMNEEIASFHTLSAEEQTVYLDERIDEMVAQREEWAKRREEMERQREAQGESQEGERGPRGGGGEGREGGPQGEGGDRPQRDPEARQERREQGRRDRLADTTPEQRAQWANYREQMRKRMEERGIEPGWGGRGGGGRGGR